MVTQNAAPSERQSMAPGSETIGSIDRPALMELLAFSVLLGLSMLAQSGLLKFAWAEARVSLSFAVGVLLPGYLILSFVRLGFDPDPLERLCLSFAAGISLQAVWCLVMMNVGGSSRLTAWLQTILALALLGAAARFGRLGALSRALLADLTGVSGSQGYLRIFLLAVLAVLAYFLAPVVPYAESEELVIGRKLFENATLSYRNVMHVPDEPTTYLYPVYLFVQAVLAHTAGLDILLVHIKLRTILTVLGILIQYSLIRGMTRSTVPAAAFALVLVGLAAWDPNSWSYSIGMIVPFNNRYGVAPWILAPLSLYLMLLLYRGVRSTGVCVLWVMFLFTTALVHAKEALQVLMIGGGLLVISMLWRGRKRRDHAAVTAAIVAAVFVLGAYSLHHRARVVSMEGLTTSIKQFVRQELAKVDALSARAWTGPIVNRRYNTAAGEYEVGSFELIVSTLRGHTIGFYFRLALALMPLLPFLRGRWQAIFLLATLYVPLVFLRTPVLYLSGAAIVGTTDLELMVPILGLASLLIVAVATSALVAYAIHVAEAGTRDAPPRVRKIAISTTVMGLAAAGFWLTRDVSGRMEAWLASDAQGLILSLLSATTIATVIAALVRRRSEARPGIDLAAALNRWPIIAVPVLAVLLVPVTTARLAPNLFQLSEEFAWQRGLIDLDEDFDRISRVGNIETDLDPDVIAFVRNQIGPHHIFATSRRYLNRLVLYTNSFANSPQRLATASDAAYHDLIDDLGSDPIFNAQDLVPLAGTIRDYLQSFGIEYLLVPPDYDRRTNQQLSLLDPNQHVFNYVYRSRGWTIWQVDHSQLKTLVPPAPVDGGPN